MSAAEAVDRETLKRIYTQHEPEKVAGIDNVISRRRNKDPKLYQAAMDEVFKHLSTKFKINALGLRQQVATQMAKSPGASPPPGGKKSASAAPASPAGGKRQPAAGAGAAAGGAAAGGGAAAAAVPAPTAAGSPPGVRRMPGAIAAVMAVSGVAGGGAAAGAGGGGVPQTLEARTLERAQRMLKAAPPGVAESKKVGTADALVAGVVRGKGGLTEKTANSMIRSLEKKLGITEAQATAAVGAGDGVGARGGDADFMSGGGAAAGGGSQSSASAYANLKPSIAQLLLDGFGHPPSEQQHQQQSSGAGGVRRREAMTERERLFYEELMMPSIKLACTPDEYAEALTEIFLRCDTGALPPQFAKTCTTSRDVADRVFRSLQQKYELRNPEGRVDFFAKFLPHGAATVSRQQQQQQQNGSPVVHSGATATVVSVDSNPMAVSRMLARNTMASSMVSTAEFLGLDAAGAGGDGSAAEPGVLSGVAAPDLGPLPTEGAFGFAGGSSPARADGGSDDSFSALLVSAMKFLDSSSQSAGGGAADFQAGGGAAAMSEKEVIQATLVIECLDWNDVVKAPELRRERFKLAVAQDVAEVLGWGELLDSGGIGKHSWRNVRVKRFTMSTAGNVHANCEILVPAGIAVEDLQSLVTDRLRRGGFAMRRSRVSLSRDLEARPAGLYCRTASFSEAESRSDPVVAESVFDATLGVSISPHRDARAPEQWPQPPIQL